jgi:hypothetical protein
MRRRTVAVVAGILAVVVGIVVFALTLPESDGLTIGRVAELAVLPATAPAPAPDPREPKLLEASVDGVAFPSYADELGWEATGARSDTIGGRRVETVLYELAGERLGYSIVAGGAVGLPGSVVHVTREGTDVHVAELGGRLVLTWLRRGRTCVLSGDGVDRETLLGLAVWRGGGAIPF